jgi:hypothetical protein
MLLNSTIAQNHVPKRSIYWLVRPEGWRLQARSVQKPLLDSLAARLGTGRTVGSAEDGGRSDRGQDDNRQNRELADTPKRSPDQREEVQRDWRHIPSL